MSVTAGLPRVRVELLGRIAIRRGDADLSALRAQPKRLALLAYLLLRRDGAAVGRDELTGVFWPEVTEARARASLRQAVRFLRLQLGADSVRAGSGGEIELHGELVECDALQLSRALALRDDRGAMELYRGELLPGLPGGVGTAFEHWLDAERERLRGGALRAALRLSDAALGRGRHQEAQELMERACELAPDDASLARRLASLREQARVALPASSASRVLVVQLENLTGDPALDVLGRLAADTLAQGLASLPDLEVAPPLAAAAAGTAAEAALRIGARVLVEGTYATQGERMQWQVRVTDVAEGRLLPAPDPVASARANPGEAIVALRDALVRTLAPALSRRAVHARNAPPPPDVAAYTAYVDGIDAFVRGEWRTALDDFRRALALQPDYALPRVVTAIALWNLGELHASKQAAQEAARDRAALSRFDRALLDMVLAWLAGDWAAAYRAAGVQAELAATSLPHFGVAEEARRLNRPREAIELLMQMDPDEGELRGWIYYWIVLTAALHMSGQHERELTAALECIKRHPAQPAALLLAARAHAALGDEGAVNDVVDQVRAVPGRPVPAIGAIMLELALELRAHGLGSASQAMLVRTIEWHREEAAAGASGTGQRTLARCLYHAGELEEARRLLLEPAAPRPARPLSYLHAHLQADLDSGYLLLIATRLGEAAEAERLRLALRELDAPLLFGAQWFWLAADAAARGERADAVRLLRRAFADGLPFELFLHADPHLALLRGDPAFEALLRPQG